ncbi:MAG: DUF1585 domain-containing protein [Planctomycetota bacterium]
MNSALAKHYGRADVLGSEFQRVSLKADSRRRGLLDQGSVLTTSANGINPLGFALENFDPVGQRRDTYEGGVEVDAFGQLPDGQAFDDISGLRRLLKDEKVEQLARSVVIRLMTCATGRTLSVRDDAEIARILSESKTTEYRFRDLIQAVVSSEAFLNK